MSQNHSAKQFETNGLAQRLAPAILALAGETDKSDEFLSAALTCLAERLPAGQVAIARGARGRWTTVCSFASQPVVADELLADALDQEKPVSQSSWVATPLQLASRGGNVLAIYTTTSLSSTDVEAVAALLSTAAELVQRTALARRRIRRLEAILEIAASWQQTQEMDDLLLQMAEASTRLIAAQRASIFLWDKPNKMLVGRPALGVEGDELRIADDTGVVGKVVQSGQIMRVDLEDDHTPIDRQVDEQLSFETKTLLCVPLFGQSGELFGAFELINKTDGSFTDDDEAALTELATHAAIALENTQQLEQLLKIRNQIADDFADRVKLIGNCPAIEAIRSTVKRVADTDLAILILGENGTGKEVISQMVHYLSRRRHEPLIAVNCAAMAETLLESELFGHEKGAFTDARETRVGKFELASGGTLFLDEIGDMSLSGQAKLLRVLEEKIVVRVGGSVPIHTDARVVAATNQNLAEMVRAKKFREDLYFRLNVVTLELPPMRERGDDIMELAEHFLVGFCSKARRKPPKFTAAARKRLLSHPWPGNVRELRNLMERLAYLASGDKIDADELAFILSPGADENEMYSWNLSLTEATKKFQADYIKKLVQQSRGNMTAAAKRLGLHRSNLYRKMHQLGMEVEE